MFFRFLLKIDDELPDRVRNDAGIFIFDYKYFNMDFSTDLLRLIWHELGHLAVDVIETDHISDSSVAEINFSYFQDAISNEKWGGFVKKVPSIKFNKLVEDSNKLSFAYICLLSGCILEKAFYKVIEDKEIEFENCFNSRNGFTGNGDFKCFNEIGVIYRKQFGNREELTKLIHFHLVDLITEQIYKEKFFSDLGNLSLNIRNRILFIYNETPKTNNFEFSIIDDELQELISELRQILKTNGIYKSIKNLQKEIMSKIELDNKYSDSQEF